MIQKIEIDLSGVETTYILFEVFSRVFGFPQYFGNNWDAFFDVMNFLTTETFLFQNMSSDVTGVHLVLLGFDIFESQFPKGDFAQFTAILIDLCANSEFRGDRLSFTFEIFYSRNFHG